MKYLGKTHVYKCTKSIQKYGNMCGTYYTGCMCGKNNHYFQDGINSTCITAMTKLGMLGARSREMYGDEIVYGENNHLYFISPIYEYPNYSTDDEINEVYKTRYRMKYNTYFFKMIQNIISFNKDDIIYVKIKDSFKLISDTTEDEYQNIEYIITNNELKFNDKYFIKYIDNNLEIYEII